jgi:hypothetical protein
LGAEKIPRIQILSCQPLPIQFQNKGFLFRPDPFFHASAVAVGAAVGFRLQEWIGVIHVRAMADSPS